MDYLYVAGFENFPDYIDMMMKKNKTPFTFQMLYPVELQAKSLCDPPGRIRTSNPLKSILLLIVSLKSSKNNKTHEFVGFEPMRFRF